MHAINSNNEDCVKVILSYQPSQSIRNEVSLNEILFFIIFYLLILFLEWFNCL